MNKIIKVGFDMDGVLLYNPIRFIRPVAKLFKPLKSAILKQQKESFYFPKTKLEIFLFSLLHKTSFMIAPGLDEIEKLVKDKKIEAFIITSRYSFLKKEYDNWIKKININKIFKGCYQNIEDLQPNDFKIKMIKKLDLDIYVEDNWDIVQKLKARPERSRRVKILWITNFLDKHINYQYKFNNLKEALNSLTF